MMPTKREAGIARLMSSRIVSVPERKKTLPARMVPPAALADAVQRLAVELETERPDLQPVADGELVRVKAVAVHEGAGGAVQIGDDQPPPGCWLTVAWRRETPGSFSQTSMPASRPIVISPIDLDALRGLPAHQHLRAVRARRRDSCASTFGGSPTPNSTIAGPIATLSPGPQRECRGDAFPIHRRAADAAEVLDDAALPVPGEAAVLPGDLDVLEREYPWCASGDEVPSKRAELRRGRRRCEIGDICRRGQGRRTRFARSAIRHLHCPHSRQHRPDLDDAVLLQVLRVEERRAAHADGVHDVEHFASCRAWP